MNKQKGFSALVVILIVVVLGLACGVGYYVWDKNHRNSWNADDETFVVKITPKPTVSPTPTKIDENADWKTYIATTAPSFTIKYPANWLTKNYSNLNLQNPNGELPVFGSKQEEIQSANGEYFPPITIAVVKYIKPGSAMSGEITRKTVLVNGKQSEQIQYTNPGMTGNTTTTSVPVDNGYSIAITYNKYENDKTDEYLNVYNKMLSTFKFN